MGRRLEIIRKIPKLSAKNANATGRPLDIPFEFDRLLNPHPPPPESPDTEADSVQLETLISAFAVNVPNRESITAKVRL